MAILIFLLPILTFAANLKIPAAGTYHYQNEFSVMSKKRYEAVYALNDAQRERLQQLISEGNTCYNTGREIYLCSKFESETGTESEIRDRLNKQMENFGEVQFSELTGEAQLISEGDALATWQIPQSVKFSNTSYENYRYIVGKGFEKIFLGEPAKHTFLIQETGQLAYPISVSITESDNVYYNYWALAFFR